MVPMWLNITENKNIYPAWRNLWDYSSVFTFKNSWVCRPPCVEGDQIKNCLTTVLVHYLLNRWSDSSQCGSQIVGLSSAACWLYWLYFKITTTKPTIIEHASERWQLWWNEKYVCVKSMQSFFICMHSPA